MHWMAVLHHSHSHVFAAFVCVGGDGKFLYIHSATQKEGDVAKVTTWIPFPASIGVCHLRFWFFMYGSDRMGTLKVTSSQLHFHKWFKGFFVSLLSRLQFFFFCAVIGKQRIHHGAPEGLIWICHKFMSCYTQTVTALHSAYCHSSHTHRRVWKCPCLQIIHQSVPPYKLHYHIHLFMSFFGFFISCVNFKTTTMKQTKTTCSYRPEM